VSFASPEPSELRSVELELEDRLAQQAAVVAVGQSAFSAPTSQQVMDVAVLLAAGRLGVDYCGVLELLEDEDALLLRAGCGWREGLVGRAREPAGTDSLSGFTLASDKPVIVLDLRTEHRFIPSSLLRDHSVISAICVPIPGEEGPFGAFGIHARRLRLFTEHDVNFVQSIANILAEVIIRKRAEADQELLAEITRSSDDAIISWSSDGIIMSWNPGAKRLYGHSASEIIGKPVATIIPSDRQGEEWEILDKVLSGQSVEHYETKRLTKEDATIAVSLTVSPLREGDGSIYGASVIAHNISDQKRIRDLEDDRDKREFITNVAHDLRNPLTAIAGLTETLQRSDLPEDDRVHVQEALIRRARQAEVLINDLLNLAHIESSGFKADIKKVEARPVIEAALSLAKPPRGKSVRVDVPSDTFVAGDPTRFGQVIENLLSNAYEYGGTDIVIAARSDGDETELTVEDNGDGVPDEIRPRLFDPFTRGHTDSKGSGLGLSIVKRLVEAFGGLITYEPGRPQGSRFVMRLRSDVDSPHA